MQFTKSSGDGADVSPVLKFAFCAQGWVNHNTGAKKVNFGLCYGTGARGLAQTIKKEGVEVLKLGDYDVDEVYDRCAKKLRLDRSDWRNRAPIEKLVDEVRSDIAQTMINKFYTEHSDAKDWIEQVHEFVLKNGYYFTPFGRIRRLPAALSGDQGMQNEALRQAQNFPVQSVALLS